MSAAEATGGRFSPLAPGRAAGARPSPKPRAERAEAPPLRVVPPVAETTTPTEAAPEAKARRIDWARASTRTSSAGRVLYRDLVDAWVWRDVPPALRAIWASAGQPPVTHPLLAAGWRAWMYGIALPVTAVGYTAIWLHQHPLRGIPADTAALAGFVFAVWG